MPQFDVKVSYLEMLAPPTSRSAPPREDLAVIHARHPTVAYFRFLYHSVGAEYAWTSRSRIPDAELQAQLNNPQIEIQVLFVDGVPAGFAELDLRTAGEVEIVQFGLIRNFIGQGLGRYFLEWTLERAWSSGPRRVWLHTCTLDHPAAIPNYEKRGFVLYNEKWIQRDTPGEFPHPTAGT